MVMGPKVTLTLKQYTEVSDGMGGVTKTWVNKRKISGVLIGLSGDERHITGKTEVYASHRFVIDYPKNLTITEKDRFVLKAREFGISLVSNPAEQNIHLEIMLEEIT